MIEKYEVVLGRPNEEERKEAIRLGLRSFLNRSTSRCNIELKKSYGEKGIVLNHSLPIFAFRDFNLEFESIHRLNGKESRRQMGVYVAAEHNAIISSPRMSGHFIGHEQEMMPEQIEVFNATSVLEVALRESLINKGLPVGRIFGFAHNVGSGEIDLDLPTSYRNGLFYMLSERGMPLKNLSERHGKDELYQSFISDLHQKGFDYLGFAQDKYHGLVCLGNQDAYKVATVEPELITKLVKK